MIDAKPLLDEWVGRGVRVAWPEVSLAGLLSGK
jgi:hypothetical protein